MTTPKNPPTIRATCGKYAGYQAHRKANELVCDDCRAARNAWERNRRAARATAADRARLTTAERTAFADAIDTYHPHHLQANLVAIVEHIIADRLLRYT